jgi:fucose permease
MADVPSSIPKSRKARLFVGIVRVIAVVLCSWLVGIALTQMYRVGLIVLKPDVSLSALIWVAILGSAIGALILGGVGLYLSITGKLCAKLGFEFPTPNDPVGGDE